MDKITLDKGIIGALASEPRVAILKKIGSGSMTLNKLTDELNISKSTVHKHLTILIESGLVKKVNKDNKWAHYELTDKGTEILHPRKMTRIIVLLSAAILSFVVGIAGLYRFVRTIYIFPEEALNLKAIAPYEPAHLITGLVLISLGIVLLSFDKKRTKRWFFIE
ncbi:MAG: helix-turn-helix domain-containing protein [Halobacteriota archaeon]